MSFRHLKEEFERSQKELEKLDVFRRLYLGSLFEINGNLDTIALSVRALVELQGNATQLMNAQGVILEKHSAIVLESHTRIAAALETLAASKYWKR